MVAQLPIQRLSNQETLLASHTADTVKHAGGGGGAASYQTIQDNGTVKAQRAATDYVGFTITDDAGNNRTIVTSLAGLSIVPAPFAVVYPGTTTVAIKCSDGTTISSNTDSATVLNAAFAAATALTNGGRVQLAHGAFTDLTAKLIVGRKVQVVGVGGSKDRPNSDVGVGTVLKLASGFTDAAAFEVGALGPTTSAGGVLLADFYLDMNSKSAHGIHGMNAQDLKIDRVVLMGPGQTSPTNKRAIWIDSDQVTNGASGAEPRIHEVWARNWYDFVYVGAVNGVDGETRTAVGATDGHIERCDAWTCKRHVTIHMGGWQVFGNHLVGNLNCDYQLYTDSSNTQVSDNYFDSVKSGGWNVEVATGSVGSRISGNQFLCDIDATAIGVKWTAQRNACVGNTFKTGGAEFLKFTNSGNGGEIANNSGTGPASNNDVLHTSAAAQITQPAMQSGTGYCYVGNIVV